MNNKRIKGWQSIDKLYAEGVVQGYSRDEWLADLAETVLRKGPHCLPLVFRSRILHQALAFHSHTCTRGLPSSKQRDILE